jgi:hypothetical protein
MQTAAEFLKQKGQVQSTNAPEKKKSFIQKASDFLLSSEKGFGQSIGETTAYLFGAKKDIEYANAGYIKAGDQMFQLAKKQTDKGKAQRYYEMAKDSYAKAGQTFEEVLPSIKKSNLQIGAEALGTAVDILTAGTYSKAGLVGKKALTTGLTKGIPSVIPKVIGKEVVKQSAKELAKNTAKTVLKDSLMGTGYGLITTAQQEGATAKDYAIGAGSGALAGTILPPVIGAGIKGTLAGTKLISKGIGVGLEKVAIGAEKIAIKEAKQTGERFYQKVYNKPSVLQKGAGVVAESIRGLQKLPSKIKTQFLDKYDALKGFTLKAREAGINAPDIQDMAQGARYRAAGKAENRLDDYIAMRKMYGNDWNVVKEYSNYLDDLDRLANGNTIAGNRTVENVVSDMKKLEASIPPEKLAKIKDGQKELQSFLNEELVNAVDSGRLSPEQYKAIKTAHKNYIPHDVLDFLDDEATASMGKGTGKSFNVSKSGIDKATGSAREIDDIDNAVVRRLYRQNILNEKNQTVAAVIDVGKQMGGEDAGFVPLRTAENVNKRISLWQDLKNKWSEQRKAYRSDKTLSRRLGVIEKTINSTEKEMNDLAGEAMVKASNFESASSINTILEKAYTRERRIFELQGKLQAGDDAVAKKELTNLINERKTTISELKTEISNLKDIKVKQPDIPKGFEKIQYFNNGVREDWLIPEDVGSALKNLSGEESGKVMSWLNNSFMGKLITAPAGALRKVATTVNPVFAAFRNPARDTQTALLTAGDDYSKGLLKTIFGKVDESIWREARSAGALQGSIYREQLKPEQILTRKINDTFNGKSNLLKKIIRPDRLIEEWGNKMEEMTRMAVFSGALKNGKTSQEAAKLARNATVDFGKSGNTLQVLNKVIPFLNARVQGFANMGKAIAENPTKAARTLLWSAAYPQAVLTAYDSRYKSYSSIPDYEKRKYWIVMVGESKGKDLDGKSVMIPNYIKIPKGEAQQAVSNIVERTLTLSKQKYPDNTSQFLTKLVGDITPVTESSLIPTGLQ